MEKRIVNVLDVTGGYLHAPIDDNELFMSLDPTTSERLLLLDERFRQFQREDGTIVVRLRKAMYGLKQSAQLWHKTITTSLKQLGFVQSSIDACLFHRNRGNDRASIAIYVDDLLITATKRKTIEELKRKLNQSYMDVKVQDNRHLSYLGMHLEVTPNGIFLDQIASIDKMMKELNVEYKCDTPASDSDLYTLHTNSPPTDATEYRSIIARLNYLAQRTRPDLSFVVSFLSARQKEPTVDDRRKLERVLEYLNGTRELKMKIQPKSWNFNCIIDASFNRHVDRMSQSGAHFQLGGAPIWSRSTKQKTIAASSTEAEINAVYSCENLMSRVRAYLTELGHGNATMKLFQDNQAAIRVYQSTAPFKTQQHI